MIEGWEEKQLGDLGQVVTGNTPSKSNPQDWGDTMLFVTPSDYGAYNKYALDAARRLSEIGVQRLIKKVLPPKSIMVTCIGSDMGKVAMTAHPTITNQQITSIIPDIQGVDSDFIYYLLVSLYSTLRLLGGDGTAVPIVNKSDFMGIKASMPIRREQTAIAEVLSSLDDKIDLLCRQNATLEALAETLFRQYFIEEAQDDWGDEALDKVADYLNGLACQKYPAKNPVERLPVLKIKDLKGGLSESSDWATSKVPPEYIVENGDIIFSWSASLLVKLWDGPTCVLNQHLFKVTSDRFPDWFIYQWTKHHLERFIAIAETKATTMGHIKRTDLAEAMVRTPDNGTLENMEPVFAPLHAKVIANNRQIATLKEKRDELLPKLMSGELRVSLEHAHA